MWPNFKREVINGKWCRYIPDVGIIKQGYKSSYYNYAYACKGKMFIINKAIGNFKKGELKNIISEIKL